MVLQYPIKLLWQELMAQINGFYHFKKMIVRPAKT